MDMFRTAAGAIAVVIAIMSFAACTGGGSDEQQVKDVMSKFGTAFADGNYADVCDMFTESAIAEFEEGPIGGSCEGVLMFGGAFIGTDDKDKMANLTDYIESVEIDGDTATVEVEDGDDPFVLIIEDGEWKIEGDG